MESAWDGIDEVIAVADAGTFVAAAQRLNVSTSHVSRAVARLEARLGAALFHRTTRRVALTETGRAFVDQGRRMAQERDELLALVTGTREPQGELRITCSIALGERFVASIVRRFANAHPRLSVTLDLTNRLIDIIGEGYDVGVRTGHVSDQRLIGRKIASRQLEVCASSGYLETAGVPLSIDALERHQCLVGTNPSWLFLEDQVPRQFSPKGRWRCNSGSAIVDAAKAGMGVCQLPMFYVRQAIETGDLRPVLQSFRAEAETIWAVYSPRRHLLPKVRNLADALADELQGKLDSE